VPVKVPVATVPLLNENVDTVVVADRESLEGVYRLHGKRLWWALLAFTGDREIASDAVAEAFAQALRAGDRIRSPADWVWRVAFRIAAGELKDRRRFGKQEVEGSYELDERAQGVVDALSRLSAKQRMAVILHYYAGYTAREIAAMTGLAAATVAVHLHRARRKLRELLEDHDG
jgi:RNA polymerase sigma-70 factor (ECF subfamily)